MFGSKLEKRSEINLLKYFGEESEVVLTYEFAECLNRNLLVFTNHYGDFGIASLTSDLKKVQKCYTDANNSPISAVGINQLDDMTFVTGDHEGYLKIWGLKNDKVFLKSERKEAHQSQILKTLWASSTELYTIGFDDSFKIFDVNSLVNTYFIYFKDSAPTAFDFSAKSNLTLTGHINGTIRLFDDKVRNKTTKKVFKSHNNFVSTIRFNPHNEHLFISADYSGKIKVWDVRGDFPVYTIDAHNDDKIFDMAWIG